MNPFAVLDPAVALLHHALVVLAAAVPIGGDGVRFALALAVLTVAVRAALLPLAVRSARQRQALAALQPRLAVLRRRYGTDRQRLLAETNRLHREAGVPRTAGLLPGLAQLPVLVTVYRLVSAPTVAGSPNLLLAAHLFGGPLAAHWPEVISAAGALGPATLALLVLLLALTALAVVSSRDLSRSAGNGTPTGLDGDAEAARAARAARAVTRLMPYGTVLVALSTPIAMGIYLLVSTAWSVAERRAIARLVTP